ncbi:O-linked N-acetylglucosamine transferase, SPINDLY family protein [Nisaea sediminum]|uniref:O-linked N-acetylglucosamine transferase, SPINDLY family protein n=1 Tax=Nisaea sediminum TaxID=2775867 RepID=UPI0018670879|nr:hypothetical protein [Nisaea sediminum]
MSNRTEILDRPERIHAYAELFCTLAGTQGDDDWQKRFLRDAPARLLAVNASVVRTLVSGQTGFRDALNFQASYFFEPLFDAVLAEQLRRGDTVFEPPLSVLERRDDPGIALAVTTSAMRIASAPDSRWRAEWGWRGGRRLRLGYVTSDLRMHPVGFSVRSMLVHHDRSRFETFVYDRTEEPVRPVQGPVRLAADHFREVGGLAPAALAERIRADGIDILVDLSGTPLSPEKDVFRRAPAPVRVAMIGFPGATGAETVDYTVADRVVVPEAERSGFSERLILMPGSFLPVDDQAEDDPAPARAELGLPEDGFVMAAFNRLNKVDMATLRLWFECLRRIPRALLWVATQSEEGADNLRRFAAQAGLAPERIRFAEPTGIRDHRARVAAADIALDPLGYNGGHTTALALARGVPVVTLPGRCFAWRMSASILAAAGVPEGIADSPADYLARVERFAADAPFLAAVRARLRQPEPGGFFSTKAYVAALEAAFLEIAGNRSAGLPDRDIEVKIPG